MVLNNVILKEKDFKQTARYGARTLKNGECSFATAIVTYELVGNEKDINELIEILKLAEIKRDDSLERFRLINVYKARDYVEIKLYQKHGFGYSWDTDINIDRIDRIYRRNKMR